MGIGSSDGVTGLDSRGSFKSVRYYFMILEYHLYYLKVSSVLFEVILHYHEVPPKLILLNISYIYSQNAFKKCQIGDDRQPVQTLDQEIGSHL